MTSDGAAEFPAYGDGGVAVVQADQDWVDCRFAEIVAFNWPAGDLPVPVCRPPATGTRLATGRDRPLSWWGRRRPPPGTPARVRVATEQSPRERSPPTFG